MKQVQFVFTTAALKCSRYCLLLSETVVVMHCNVGNCTTKRTNITKDKLQISPFKCLKKNRHLEKVTFMNFQHSTCINFRGTY
jgi:hypothetical protein